MLAGSDIDPVACFELYLRKLNKNHDDLWQKPKEKISRIEPVWYDNVPVGHDTLTEAMKKL